MYTSSVDVNKIPKHCCELNCCCRKLVRCESYGMILIKNIPSKKTRETDV